MPAYHCGEPSKASSIAPIGELRDFRIDDELRCAIPRIPSFEPVLFLKVVTDFFIAVVARLSLEYRWSELVQSDEPSWRQIAVYEPHSGSARV
jgi:hypothetical protein